MMKTDGPDTRGLDPISWKGVVFCFKTRGIASVTWMLSEMIGGTGPPAERHSSLEGYSSKALAKPWDSLGCIRQLPCKHVGTEEKGLSPLALKQVSCFSFSGP